MEEEELSAQAKWDGIIIFIFLIALVCIVSVTTGFAFKQSFESTELLGKNVASMASLFKNSSPTNIYIKLEPDANNCYTLDPKGVIFERQADADRHYLPYEDNSNIVSIPSEDLGWTMRITGLQPLLPYVNKIKDDYYIILCADPRTHTVYVVSKMDGRKDVSMVPLKNTINLLADDTNNNVCTHLGIAPHSIGLLPTFVNIKQ